MSLGRAAKRRRLSDEAELEHALATHHRESLRTELESRPRCLSCCVTCSGPAAVPMRASRGPCTTILTTSWTTSA